MLISGVQSTMHEAEPNRYCDMRVRLRLHADTDNPMLIQTTHPHSTFSSNPTHKDCFLRLLQLEPFFEEVLDVMQGSRVLEKQLGALQACQAGLQQLTNAVSTRQGMSRVFRIMKAEAFMQDISRCCMFLQEAVESAIDADFEVTLNTSRLFAVSAGSEQSFLIGTETRYGLYRCHTIFLPIWRALLRGLTDWIMMVQCGTSH